MSQVEKDSLLSVALNVDWASAHARHRDIQVFEKFNVWRDGDLLPAGLGDMLLGKECGYRVEKACCKGDVIETWTSSKVHTVKRADFNTNARPGLQIEPTRGRFYPQGWVSGVKDVFRGNMLACRLIEHDGETLTFDFNHPMSMYDMSVGIEVRSIDQAPGERGGRCTEHIRELLDGPGMQAAVGESYADFFSTGCLQRIDDSPDDMFYSVPRMVSHLDAAACEQIENLYAELIPENARVLDLMAGWDSHLPSSLSLASVQGLGMNREELEANTRLDTFVVHDLNKEARLPCEDASMDAVICTASVEYLVDPVAVFREVRRVLAPGGVFVNAFSNRCFPTKAIVSWNEMHEFERLGMVAACFIEAGGYAHIETRSIRGLPRPEDDAYADRLLHADPVYAAWARRSE